MQDAELVAPRITHYPELVAAFLQARYRGPDRLLDGTWVDPEAGCVPLVDFAAAWISERPSLRPKTLELYRYLLRRHLAPGFTGQTIAGITEADARRWRAGLLAAGSARSRPGRESNARPTA